MRFNFKNIFFILIFILIFTISCNKWRVNELFHKQLFLIPRVGTNINRSFCERNNSIIDLINNAKFTIDEIINLNPKNINLEKSEIKVKNLQTKKIKKIKLNEQSKTLIDKYLNIRNKLASDESPLFLNNLNKKMSKLSIEKIIKKYKNTETACEKIDNNLGAIDLKFGEGDVLGLSFSIKVSNEKVYCADNRLKRLQVFDLEGNTEVVIGNDEEGDNKSDIKKSKFSFGIIDKIVADSEGKIYVQNRLVPKEAKKIKNLANFDITPSYILVFDNNGKLQYTLGQRGTTDLPFYYIENLFTDSKDRMFVISKTFGTWSVFRFVDKKRDFFVKFGKEMFKESEGKEEYTGEIENILVFKTGEKLLISVAYYHKTRFKYRKIIEYSIANDRLGKTILDVPDPKNELYTLLDDKYILLWDVDERDIRFIIWNFQGNIMNNIKMQMHKNKGYFEEIAIDEKGKFYTYIVNKSGINIAEWE